MFPSVRLLKVKWKGNLVQAQEYHYISKPIEMAPLKSSVRVPCDGIYCELVFQTLTFNLSDALEQL
jgi:hypothetical protein